MTFFLRKRVGSTAILVAVGRDSCERTESVLEETTFPSPPQQVAPWVAIVRLALLSWLAICGQVHAGTYSPAPPTTAYPQAIRQNQPPGLTLTLTFPKDHFFQGEEIPATLTFSNKSKAAYHLTTANWNRSRGVMDDIKLYGQSDKGEPVPDPVAWYLRRTIGMEGGGGNTANLGEWSLTAAANQWLRFDHPGVYTIHAWSGRVLTGTFKDFRDISGGDQVQLVSNQVTITIDPLTPQEEKAVIDQAQKIIAQPGEASFMPDGSSNTVTKALERLCWLQTPAARSELYPFLSEGNNDTGRLAALGIAGAPDPKAEAQALLAAVEKGKPVLNEFTTELYAALNTSDFPGGGLLYRSYPIDPFGKAVRDAQQEMTDACAKASGGQGPAYIGALWAAFEGQPQDPAARTALVQHQLELSSEQRKQLIFIWQSEVWKDGQSLDPAIDESMKEYRQGGPDLLPVLRKATGAPDYNPYALEILGKIAPEEARSLIIEDIKRDKSLYLNKPKTVFSWPLGLDSLPKKPIPELTETFRRKLKNNDEDTKFYTLPLLERYGTPDLLPDVIRFYQPNAGNWECAVENAVLRFWIRTDPPAGLKALQHTLHSRERTRCYAELLEKVFSDYWSDEAQPIVIKALADSNPDVVISAIKTLERHANQDCVDKAISALEHIHTTTPPEEHYQQPLDVLRQQQSYEAQQLLESKRWSYSSAQQDRLKQIVATSK